MSYSQTTITHQPRSAATLSVRSPSTGRPIHDLLTYELFEGLPILPSVPATHQLWSTDARFYQGSSLDPTRLPPTQRREAGLGSIPYITLPKNGHSAQASIQLRVDSCGIPYFDPVVERTRTSKYQESNLPRYKKRNSATSLLETCHSLGVVGDPRGHEKLAAFGRVPRMGSFEDEEENEWWTPDWAIVSGVLRSGAVRRALEGCGLPHISVDGEMME